ncbi:MAG: type I 3-dehydroquinate dehydratase [Thermoanaerobaculales bacterium]|jgi:shikimate dehydrogenase/3-dehydroquinate dehydratase type I|nr:type I 3-dehydroquinate dehydratase [Thermoanaerobaculales bacterium]
MQWIVSLTPEVSEDPCTAIASPPDGASVVELRVDLFPTIDIATAIASCPLPVLATLRSTAEGGRGSVDPVVRKRTLAVARDAGAALIDLEFARDATVADEIGLAPEQIVLSWHDSAGTPDDFEATVAALHASRARIVKAIPTAGSLADLERVLALHSRFNHRRAHNRRLITFAMGTVGIASRILAPLLGPHLSFAAWHEGAAAAPGQLTIRRIEAVMGHLQGRPRRLYGVVGSDVGRSLSPVLHGAAYKALGLPYLFVPVSVPDDADLAEIFTELGGGLFDRAGLAAHGWAVTTPYKGLAAAAAEMVAPRVVRAAAANTLVLREAGMAADNTDADGVVASLLALGQQLEGRTALVQGTGGAARGAAVGLYLAGAEVSIRGRDAARTRTVADVLEINALEPDEPPERAAILVNATPLGSSPDDHLPFSETEISAAGAIVDMVYADDETPLAVAARKAGVPSADGIDVLAHQAFAQFAAFTGKLPPKEAMLAAVGRSLGQEEEEATT